MPGKIKVKVLAGRNLPVMDRASDTTDAFVEIKFGSVTHKTDVCRKSLNPHWNSTEWYRFEVDESELQDEPLQLRLMDHDTYSANDAIGKVVISLAPLLAREASNAKSTTTPHGGAVMSGWIPVFDTMHGIRGELNVIVKVELFSDFNKYKTSSCGVQFFHCPMIPPGYRATSIHGFVEELVVNDDPEYQWIDKIRTPRASNEARQVAFIKLSNQVQRLVGLKAAELGANAVVGYQQEFDLEGEAGVVARAIGTAVSITPLPTPSHPVNMPPCTQQQLKKYLDILVTDNESLTDLSQYYQTHQDELQKMLNILNPNASALLDGPDTNDDEERSMDNTRNSSITSYAGSVSIYHDEYIHHKGFRHLSEDQTDLNRLLNKESDESDSSGPLQKIKKIKTNFFSRKFSTRSKKSDKQDDSISLKSNTSESSRLSFVDIKNELKKLKRLKKPKFRKAVVVNKDDEGEGMASILARSVIHAHTNLACIAETQDSEHSPGSTMRRTTESEPTLSISDDEGTNVISKGHEKDIPEIRFNSLSNINIDNSGPERERKTSESCPATPMLNRSENLLILPSKEEYYGSVSSALSAESSEIDSRETTTDEDDESSDLKTDTDKSIETTSSIVQAVLSNETDPMFIADMEEKLCVLGNARSVPKIHESTPEPDKKIELKQQNFNSQLLIDKCKSLESVPHEIESNNFKPAWSNEDSKSPVKVTCVIKSSSHTIKFHNPFAHKKAAISISEPSSPVEKCSFLHRSSKRIRRQLSKLSKSNMIKSFSHYSLHPKKKETRTPLSQPGSSSDIQSKVPSDTVLGAPFLSYNDLLSLDKDTNARHNFHKSEEFNRDKFSLSQPGSSSDIQSKVPSDTVLGAPFLSYNDLLSLDKDSNVRHNFHKSEEFNRDKFSMYIGSEPPSRASLSGPSFSHHKEEHHDHKKSSTCLKSSGLVHTAMETILLDKVQNLLISTSPDPDSVKSKQFFADVNEKLGKVEQDRNKESLKKKLIPIPLTINSSPPVSTKPVIVSTVYKKDKNTGLVKTAMETMLMDRIQSVLVPSTPSSPKPELVFTEPDEKRDGLKGKFKNPIEIIHSLITPKSPESLSPTEKSFDSKRKKERKQSGLIHTAMETMLLEKVQSVLGPEAPEPSYFSVFDSYDTPKMKINNNLDKVQATVLGDNVSDPIIPIENIDHELNSKEEVSSGLTHTAMETILMDKVQSLVGVSDLPHITPNIVSDHHPEKNSDYEANIKSGKDDGKGLVKTPMETILLEKFNVTDLGPSKAEPIVPSKETCNFSSKETTETKGLTNSAIKTILIDKVYSVVGHPEMTFVEPTTLMAPKMQDPRHLSDDLKSPDLVQTAVQTILLDKVQSLVGKDELNVNRETAAEQPKETSNKNSKNLETTGLVHTAFESTLLDKIQVLVPTESKKIEVDTNKGETRVLNEEQRRVIDTAEQTVLKDKVQSLVPVTEKVEAKTKTGTKLTEKSKSVPEPKIKTKKLSRQDSIHSLSENESPKMSHTPNTSPRDVIKAPAHPTLGMLETIPSLSESSIDHETVEETNISVCDNSHAVCGANRSERERRQEDKCDKDNGSPRHARHESYGGREPPPPHVQNSSLNASSTPMGIHRRSSDSDLSVTPKGGSLNTSAGNVGSGGGAILRPSMNSNNLDLLEYPFLTMTEYPPGFIVHFGGTVCARSVKLAEGEGAARAAAWAELRTELRAHARALRCNAVLAYCDTAAICEDVCVLSASGTAAVINLDCDFNAETDAPPVTVKSGSKGAGALEEPEGEYGTCSMTHVPYSPGAGPYRAQLAVCAICRRARVPNVLLATCAKPNKLASQAKAVTLTAVAARVRRAPPTSEPGARDISDQLPFLEYELHKLLLAKLRMQGANAIFSLQTQIAVGERCVMALATGSAVRLCALPGPAPPTIKASENDKDAAEIQKALWDTFTANRAANGYDVGVAEHNTNGVLPEAEGEDQPALDLCVDKDACVLELDEAEDVETARALSQRHVNMQVYTNSLKPVIGAPPHAFAQVWRGRVALGGGVGAAGERHVRRALDGVAYKLRRLQPCALVAPKIRLELPEDEIQLVVSGAAIPLQDPNNPNTAGTDTRNGNQSSVHPGAQNHGNGDDDDIFALDEEQLVKTAPPNELVEEKTCNNTQAVSLTSLCEVSGGRFARRVCALRLLFVRETTAVRELGGLSGFLHTFTCEVLAIARAYTAALGGNALTSFYITQLMLQDNAHKNQGQCLLSVGGDVVHITY